VIIDLPRFIAAGSPSWHELEALLERIEGDPNAHLTLDEVKRFHFLYERSASDLARLNSHAEPETRRYLENLVTRAYGEIHETRGSRTRLNPIKWFLQTLPQTFRRHLNAFLLSVAITVVGMLFGAAALAFDPDAKQIITPFPHLLQDPQDRVAKEESAEEDRMQGGKSMFSAQLMTHNTKVSILALALGMTWGAGTVVLLFYNGVILGAVGFDYIRAGETEFLFGWLLPHGSVEIPAILIAGQAGLVLAGALIGWGVRQPLSARLRAIGADLVTLIFGVGLLLVWAGFVESFLSQYHEPVFPYWIKITLGTVELVLLFLYLFKSGSSTKSA
jgi:uncharacterized membrane protein SpoIIM required for sporulation